MNATFEEEARRKARILHVRIVGWEQKEDATKDAKALALKIGAESIPIATAWRVGKDDTQPKALILRFEDMRKKRHFWPKGQPSKVRRSLRRGPHSYARGT